jgi:PAS domain S-box-containing protein
MPHHDNNYRNTSVKRQRLFKLLVSLVSIFAYAAIYKIFSPLIGDGAAIAAIAPVIVIAMLYGLRTGIIAAILIALPLNSLLLAHNGYTFSSAVLSRPPAYLGAVSLMVIGAIIGYLHDLRDRLRQLLQSQQRISNELKQAHARIESILHTAPCAIYTVDTDRKITSWNRMAEKITGQKAADVIGRPCLDIWDCAMCRNKCGLIAPDVEKPVFDKECEVTLPDSRRIVIQKSIDSICDSTGTIIGGVEVFLDITQIREYQKALQKKDIEILDFTNAVAHDLKNPLTGIRSVFRLLDANPGLRAIEDVMETIAIGSETADYMQTLLNDLLDTARLESGSRTLAIEKVYMQEIVDGVVSRLYMQAGVKKIDIKTDVPVELMADPKELVKIFMNLTGNAIAYMGNPPQPQITIGVRHENSGPVFFVCDNGIGIPANSLPNIFEKFRRGSNIGTIKGTGLGLSITKGIVEAHGGRIWVESEEGKGTTFYFTLGPSKDTTV